MLVNYYSEPTFCLFRHNSVDVRGSSVDEGIESSRTRATGDDGSGGDQRLHRRVRASLPKGRTQRNPDVVRLRVQLRQRQAVRCRTASSEWRGRVRVDGRQSSAHRRALEAWQAYSDVKSRLGGTHARAHGEAAGDG